MHVHGMGRVPSAFSTRTWEWGSKTLLTISQRTAFKHRSEKRKQPDAQHLCSILLSECFSRRQLSDVINCHHVHRHHTMNSFNFSSFSSMTHHSTTPMVPPMQHSSLTARCSCRPASNCSPVPTWPSPHRSSLSSSVSVTTMSSKMFLVRVDLIHLLPLLFSSLPSLSLTLLARCAAHVSLSHCGYWKRYETDTPGDREKRETEDRVGSIDNVSLHSLSVPPLVSHRKTRRFHKRTDSYSGSKLVSRTATISAKINAVTNIKLIPKYECYGIVLIPKQ